jgi:hypothetical protein
VPSTIAVSAALMAAALAVVIGLMRPRLTRLQAPQAAVAASE